MVFRTLYLYLHVFKQTYSLKTLNVWQKLILKKGNILKASLPHEAFLRTRLAGLSESFEIDG